MTEIDVIQGSNEWLTLRLGKITGTRLKDVYKSDNMKLLDLLIAEIVSQEIEETYTNKTMQRGKDLEPIARELYCKVKDIEIEEIGFCLSDEHDFLAISPDGYTKDRKGGIEIKCPNTSTHVQYIRQNKIPSEHESQVLCNFLVNEKLEWMDFISFDPRFKERPMFIKRVYRNDILGQLEIMEAGLIEFQEKVLKNYEKIVQ